MPLQPSFEPSASASREASVQRPPIVETATSVSYLGVQLEKAKVVNRKFVPKQEQYKDYFNDTEIALPLQRDIAVAFLNGDPLLVEGGTALGKTTTVKKMCADLGWEVHYVNLNGATDVEDLMGRYIPNTKKTQPGDPDFVFADGKVTTGLRQEEGKTKVIILDEYTAAASNVLIRLHEVLDALERDGEVVLSEDASEAVPTNKNRTKIIALTNPPGQGFKGKHVLDPAQLRRWIYKKMPTQLPADTFSQATDALFGLESTAQPMNESQFFDANESTLLPEQLKDIPGIREILKKYQEFHEAAKGMLRSKRVAEDQPQPFQFDDRMEPKRVRDFILRFYRGDINKTMQDALRFFYSNKLESAVDKAKFDELIRLVESGIITPESQRRGLPSKTKPAEATSPAPASAVPPAATPASASEPTPTPARTSRRRRPGSSTPEVKESIAAFDEKTLDFLLKLRDDGASLDDIVRGLSGMDSQRAWDIRDIARTEGGDMNALLFGLAGVDSERAWTLRNEALALGTPFCGPVAASLAGLNSDFSWDLRNLFLSIGIDALGPDKTGSKEILNRIAEGLAGVDSDKAIFMREELLQAGADANAVAAGMAGVDSEQAWALRKRLFVTRTADMNHLALGMTGLDSPSAWEQRAIFAKTEGKREGIEPSYLLASLAGLDSPEARRMRNDFAGYFNGVALGLAGLNNELAWKMRKNAKLSPVPKKILALSLSGDHLTFVWRLKQAKVEAEAGETSAVSEEEKQTREYLEAFERGAVKDLRKLFDKGASTDALAKGMAGLGLTMDAWKFRDFLLKNNSATLIAILQGLAGVDSPEAWEMRENSITGGMAVLESLAKGLAGLDSPEAWAMRKRLQSIGVPPASLLDSLVGVDSEQAQAMRKEYVEQKGLNVFLLGSLNGINSPQAWEWRKKYIVRVGSSNLVLEGLAGLDTPEAWAMREPWLLSEGSMLASLVKGLAGINSPEAWLLRDRALRLGLHNAVVLGLAGLSSPRAVSMREQILRTSGSDTDQVALGIAGDYLSFVWRLNLAKPVALEVSPVAEEERTVESLEAFERRALEILNDLAEKGASPDNLIRGMAGLDLTAEAWRRRDFLSRNGATTLGVIQGLAGIDAPEAWNMRERFVNEGKVSLADVASTLAGIDSPKAWRIREILSTNIRSSAGVIQGLAGLDSERAWDLRKRYAEQKGLDSSFIKGLNGINSRRAWDWREEYVRIKEDPSAILEELSGLDTPEAWEWRERYLPVGNNIRAIVQGLSGIDSPRAWALRDQAFTAGHYSRISIGLAGLTSPRAQQMREKFMLAGLSVDQVALGIAGDQDSFVWRFQKKAVTA